MDPTVGCPCPAEQAAPSMGRTRGTMRRGVRCRLCGRFYTFTGFARMRGLDVAALRAQARPVKRPMA